MTQNELKQLIAKNIAGQGDAVDISGKLQTILEQLSDKVTDEVIELPHAQLVALKNESGLKAGAMYRITDYVTTTMQDDTASAGHAFDVVVFAIAKNALSEIAFALPHANDEYFANSNLGAWELKYTTDNIYWSAVKGFYAKDENGYNFLNQGKVTIEETEYFLWKAVSGEIVYESDIHYLVSETAEADATMYEYDIETGEIVEGGSTITIAATFEIEADGKGTIYYMKDEFGNECPYDFKNILFKRWKATDSVSDREGLDGKYMVANLSNVAQGLTVEDETDFIMAYTFSSDAEGGEQEDYSLGGHDVYLNTMKPYEHYGFVLNNNVFFGIECNSNSFGNGCISNSLGSESHSNSIGDYCSTNSFGNEFISNSIGDYCSTNSFGNDCNSNSFGNDCNYIEINENVKFATVQSGTKGTGDTALAIAFEASKEYPQYAGFNSSGVLKIWTPADLVE